MRKLSFFENDHLMKRKKFTTPSKRDEIRLLNKILTKGQVKGCEMNRKKKREDKILSKRLNPVLKKDLE